ncbi:hypothetical protein MKQ70_22975 [Chitinophaga sedimenti]|uniref:hypothetical protein n=1 Tax=Chitinophaga sedimenti TaxID=2033606 RepID=UPI0020060DDE|nr:hypothetical protein [Chitinophaga sedimenti]MCK7557712.1 hypothetical protein [Chitinophaga sedimenti]
MKNLNLFNAEIPADVTSKVLANMKECHELLKPFLTPLTKEDRRGLPKLGTRTIEFVYKVFEYVQSHPQFIPIGVTLADMDIDRKGREEISRIMMATTSFYEALEDTYMKVGSEFYKSALEYFDTVKRAADRNVPDAKTISDDISIYFKKGARAEDPAEEEVTNN